MSQFLYINFNILKDRKQPKIVANLNGKTVKICLITVPTEIIMKQTKRRVSDFVSYPSFSVFHFILPPKPSITIFYDIS